MLAVGLAGLLLMNLNIARAEAQPGWILPAQEVSETAQSLNHLDLATGPDGTVIAVWREFDGETLAVRAAVRPPGGFFGTPVPVSAPGSDADDPRVAVGPDGFAVIVWKGDDGSGDVVQARVRHPNGLFGPVEDLSEDGADATEPALAVAPDGTATVAWARFDGADWIIEARVKRPDEAFGPVETLSEPGRSSFRPSVAVSPAGTFHVVWFRFNGSKNVVQTVSRPPEGEFTEPGDLSAPDVDALDPSVVVRPDGSPIVVWKQTVFVGSSIAKATTDEQGDYGPAEVISAPDQATRPQVATDSNGNYAVVWLAQGDDDLVRYRYGSGETLSLTQSLSPAGGSAGEPTLTFSPNGDLTVAWHNKEGGDGVIQARSRSATDGALSPTTDLSNGSGNSLEPRLVSTPDGVVTAAWVTYGNFVGTVESASTSPPRVGLTIEKDPGGLGTVASEPSGIDCGETCTAEFEFGSSVRLTATPAEGHTFVEWTGACSGSSTTCEPTMDQARTVRAVFAPRFEVLVERSGPGTGRVISTPHGIDCGSSCVSSFDKGETVTLTADPGPGSRFVGWSGDCLGTAPTCELTVTQARLVTARFERFCEKRSLSLGKAKRDHRRGRLIVNFVASGPGKLRLRPTGATRGATVKVGRNGRGRIAVRLSGRGKRRLARKGRITFRARFTFRSSNPACRPVTRGKKLRMTGRR